MRTRYMLTLAMMTACSGGQEAPPVAAPSHPDVLLITLDTTRADRLGAWGYDKAHTPTLDALAASGRRYDRAYSPVPYTIPAHAAILTGRYPANLGVRDNNGSVLSEDALTLAEVMSAQGYQTAASVAAYVTSRRWGFSQGFGDFYDEVPPQKEGNFWHASRDATTVVNDAITWLDGHKASAQPRFLWVHLYDAHHPYLPPEDALAHTPGRPYDGELAYMDAEIGRLLAAWGERKPLVVVAGDHGESLGEHGELEHGLFTYGATQHVPLMLAGPGVEPAVIASPVSLVDVAPTVLALAGLSGLPDADGVDLAKPPERAVYFESWSLRDRFGLAPHVGVVSGDYAYLDTPRPELYDLSADPAQKQNLFDADASRAQSAAKSLQESLAAFAFAPPQAGAVGADRDVAEQLAALGYVQGSFAGEADAVLPDPKDHLALISGAERADQLVQLGEREEALKLLTELSQKNPTVMELYLRRGGILKRLGRGDEERAVLLQAMDVAPDNGHANYALAASYAQAGDYAAAAPHYRVAAERLPWLPRVRAEAVASVLAQPDRRQEAIRLGESFLSAYPDDYAVAGLVGVAKVGSDPEGAFRLLERGLLAEVPERNVALLLARRAQAQGDAHLAGKLALVEVRHHPRYEEAVIFALKVFGELKDNASLIEVADLVLAVNPTNEAVLHARAQAQFNLKDYAAARISLDDAMAKHPQSAILALLDANLLAKEGKGEEAKRRFAVAQQLQAATVRQVMAPDDPKDE